MTTPFSSPVDTLFAKAKNINDFSFNAEVAAIFPDMIQRSVPGYSVIVNYISLLAPHFAQAHTTLYDLGCSLGAVSMLLQHTVKCEDTTIIAIDQSADMIARAQVFFDTQRQQTGLIPVQLKEGNILCEEYLPSSFVVLNFTLQFIAPEARLTLLRTLHRSLVPKGALFLSEKIRFSDPQQDQCLNELHLRFKRTQGYSELEIAQKRQALENVMKIDTITQHEQRLKAAGFRQVYVWFQCLNFCSILALP